MSLADLRDAGRVRLHGTNGAPASPPQGESLGATLEHLIAGSQGLIAKRLDLALLEGEDLFSRRTEHAALVGVGVLLLAGACLAITHAISFLVIDNPGSVLRVLVFGLLNFIAAMGALVLARRQGRHSSREVSRIHETTALKSGPRAQARR